MCLLSCKSGSKFKHHYRKPRLGTVVEPEVGQVWIAIFDSCVRRRSSGTCYGPPQPATVMVLQAPMGLVPPLSGVVVLPSVVYVAPNIRCPCGGFFGGSFILASVGV